MRAVVLAMLLAACTADDRVPACADVGCGSAALCNRKGECSCPQPDAQSITCGRELPDAGP